MLDVVVVLGEEKKGNRITSPSNRFSISENSAEKSGDISVISSSWKDSINAAEDLSSGNIEIKSGNALKGESGDIKIESGSSEYSNAGSINLVVGQSGSGVGSEIKIEAGSTLDETNKGGNGGIRAG